MLKKWEFYVFFASFYCSTTHFSEISGIPSNFDEQAETTNTIVSNGTSTDIDSAYLLNSKEEHSNFRLDPMNQQISVPQKLNDIKLCKQNKNSDKKDSKDNKESSDKKDADVKTTTETIQVLNNEQQVKAMIQQTYRRLAEDFRKLEELMKKQEEVEKKMKEERTEKIDGLNNIITIENVHSGIGNYTRVTLSKRKITEVRHRMPLPVAQKHKH